MGQLQESESSSPTSQGRPEPVGESQAGPRRLGIWATYWNVHTDPVAVGRSIAAGGQMLNEFVFTLAYLLFLYAALFLLLAPLSIGAGLFVIMSTKFQEIAGYYVLLVLALPGLLALCLFLADKLLISPVAYWICRRNKTPVALKYCRLMVLYVRAGIMIDCALLVFACAAIRFLMLEYRSEWDYQNIWDYAAPIWLWTLLSLFVVAVPGSLFCILLVRKSFRDAAHQTDSGLINDQQPAA
jgi:hypothetical protein